MHLDPCMYVTANVQGSTVGRDKGCSPVLTLKHACKEPQDLPQLLRRQRRRRQPKGADERGQQQQQGAPVQAAVVAACLPGLLPDGQQRAQRARLRGNHSMPVVVQPVALVCRAVARSAHQAASRLTVGTWGYLHHSMAREHSPAAA